MPASDETAAAEFAPLPTVPVGADGAAFTALPVRPELAGTVADGDVAMEPPQVQDDDDAMDESDDALAPAEESAEQRRARLEQERKKRKRAEQTALADAAVAKETAGQADAITPEEQAALDKRKEETARGKRRREATANN